MNTVNKSIKSQDNLIYCKYNDTIKYKYIMAVYVDK